MTCVRPIRGNNRSKVPDELQNGKRILYIYPV